MATLATIYKISADISDLQAGMSKAVTAIDSMERNTAKATSSLSSLGTKMAAAFGGTMLIDRAASAVAGFVSEAIESAGAILDLSKKTGLATDTIQRMAFVAKQTGSDVEAFTRAAFMLGINIEKGRGQIDGLGLSFAELKTLRPDEQFAKVVKALEEMEDPQERNRVAVELFGKAAQEILPSIAEGYSKIADQATVSERAQLEAIDRAADAWDGFVTNTQTKIVSTLGSAVMAVQKFGEASWAQRAKLFGLQAAGQLTAEAVKDIFPEDVRKDFQAADRDISEAGNTLYNLGGVVIPPTRDQLQKLAKDTRASAERFKDFEAAIRATGVSIRDGLGPPAEAMRDWLPDITSKLEAAAKSQREFDDAIRGTGITITSGLGPPVDAMKDWLPEIRQHLEHSTTETQSWRDSLGGASGMMNLFSQSVSGIKSVLAEYRDTSRSAWANIASYYEGGLQATQGAVRVMMGDLSGLKDLIVGSARQIASAWNLIKSVFDRDKGRDMVEDFAKSLGGFDALHRQLNQLGNEGERLWILLTQGVGRNNKEQAAAAIEEVRRALEKLQQTANSIPRDIDIDLTVTRTDRSGTLEEIEDGVPSFAFGSGGIRDFGSGGTLAMLHNREAVVTEPQWAALAGGGGDITVNVVTTLDGEEIARNTTRHQSRYLSNRRKLGRG